ncbi:hypothetical protein Wcon_01674 [Wolbachia endosymbiont of Cylisticus convexus]|nr:hypothetical protein Wxf_02885 [Armadillidium vulgare] [Wolbachia endosymbiont of Armadillidium vulgare]OJH30926.1 hypothetical protein Wxf_00295 [Wolbachia endosymbiont of Armadillidium vulgare]OJH31357.1 hypothetical protein Wxf_00747 [Wolbachia endosymbiont of Armadillidium vulgare]OJH32332.1 hypothetical protein Wxf_01761 [Wolbachia endosymbiont of Armadillidium vulgare]RDD34259.1 hypothetical protein Wcon_01674 [Wolbachia endosymbiont of Cylisticus convexus]
MKRGESGMLQHLNEDAVVVEHVLVEQELLFLAS